MMPLKPEDIQGRHFRATFRGYDIDAVNHFLAEVASDYQLLLDAVTESRTSAKDDHALSSAGADALASAKKSADSLLAGVRRDADKTREEARAEARQIRVQAAQEAAAIKEEAQEMAAGLLEEIHASVALVHEEIESLKASPSDVEQIRSDALQESEAITATAREKATTLLHEAELFAHNIITEAQRGYDDRLQQIAERLAEMEAAEEALVARVTAWEELLKSAPTTLYGIEDVESSADENPCEGTSTEDVAS